jgi:hypothetical protein
MRLGLRQPDKFSTTEDMTVLIGWVADDHVPTFIESTATLERLHAPMILRGRFQFQAFLRFGG